MAVSVSDSPILSMPAAIIGEARRPSARASASLGACLWMGCPALPGMVTEIDIIVLLQCAGSRVSELLFPEASWTGRCRRR
jgi:hypothetical protein